MAPLLPTGFLKHSPQPLLQATLPISGTLGDTGALGTSIPCHLNLLILSTTSEVLRKHQMSNTRQLKPSGTRSVVLSVSSHTPWFWTPALLPTWSHSVPHSSGTVPA
jgi:hypothetical protein